MKKMWVCVFALLFVLLPIIIFFGEKIGLSKQAVYMIEGGLWLGCLVAAVGALTEDGRTDGDLISGAEDEDGLVFALKTPVDRLVQKNKVIFHVQKERR